MLVAVVMLAACSSGGSSAKSATGSKLSAPAGSVSPAFAAMLTKAGIPIVPTATVHPPPFAYNEWQAYTMELGVKAGNGLTGDQLDALVAMPPGVPGLGYFVAAWIKLAGSPQAKAAGGIMKIRDYSHPERLVFPLAVLALFTNDAWSHLPAKLESASSAGGPAETAQLMSLASNPCSTITGFVTESLNKVFNAIKLEPKFSTAEKWWQKLGVWLATIYNVVVDIAHKVVSGLVSVFTAPIVQIITIGIGAVSVITEIAGYITGFTLDLQMDPDIGIPLHTGELPNHGDGGDTTFRVVSSGRQVARRPQGLCPRDKGRDPGRGCTRVRRRTGTSWGTGLRCSPTSTTSSSGRRPMSSPRSPWTTRRR